MKSPIFVIGNPRSGTTLLRLMLTCHPNICVPPEAGWLINLYPKYRDFTLRTDRLKRFVDDLFSPPKIEGWGLERFNLLERLEEAKPTDYATLASHVYLYYASVHQPGKSRWGDKNNFHLNHIEKIHRLFPDAHFLHIIRDGRDVACSYRDLSQIQGEYAPKLSASICGAAYDWVKNIKIIQKSFATIGQGRTLAIRYEDLVQQPHKTLQMVCDFLGEDYDERMLSFAEENRKKQLEPEMFMNWKTRTKEQLTDTRAERWKREMFEEDRYLFQLLAKETLMRYGYEIEHSLSVPFASRMLRLYVSAWLLGQRGQKLIRRLKRKMGSLGGGQ